MNYAASYWCGRMSRANVCATSGFQDRSVNVTFCHVPPEALCHAIGCTVRRQEPEFSANRTVQPLARFWLTPILMPTTQTVTLTVTSPLGIRAHVFSGPRAAKTAAYWAGYWTSLGYAVRW